MADVKIASLTENTSPTDTNIMIIEDNSDTKKITFANIKATLKTYFDGLYATVANLNIKAPLDNPTFTGTQTLPNIVTNGIKFPATQVPSADPNTLDDYEEGTFTPVLYGVGSAGTATYNIRSASYTKVGRSVSFQIYLDWSSHTGSAGMRLSGLPFQNLVSQLASMNISYVHNVTLNAGTYLGGYIDGNVIVFVSNAVGGGTITPFDVSVSGAIMLSGTYNTI